MIGPSSVNFAHQFQGHYIAAQPAAPSSPSIETIQQLTILAIQSNLDTLNDPDHLPPGGDIITLDDLTPPYLYSITPVAYNEFVVIATYSIEGEGPDSRIIFSINTTNGTSYIGYIVVEFDTIATLIKPE